ncbi:hypothetical protein ASE94_06410 [Devosia sp. Leaf64]|nr:hypothetical protein ASE94_06410 [Devosia sp. Leaf64]
MRTRSAAAPAHKHFQLLTENTDLIAWATDVAGECCYLSPEWFTFTGAAKDHGLGLTWISLIHPKDVARVRRSFFQAYENRSAYSSLFRLARAGDNYSTVWAVALPKFNDDDEFQGFQGTVCIVEEHQADTFEDELEGQQPLRRRLTDRECEILRLISEGSTSESVAAVLGITGRTVDTHISNAGAKLGAFNRVHAVALAMKFKLI